MLRALALWIACINLLPAVAFGQNQPFIITDRLKEQSVSSYADYLKVSADTLSLSKIVANQHLLPFVPTGMEDINFGFSKDVFWFRLRVVNRSSVSDKWVLESSYPIIDSLTFFIQDANNRWQTFHTGDMIPFSQRNFADRRLVLPLDIPVGQERTIFIRLKTESSILMPLRIKHQDTFYQTNNIAELAYGIYYGVIMVMLLYNLFIFASLRDVNYLYYCISIGGGLMFFSATNGHALYLWGDSVWWANKAVPFAIGTLTFGSALFARSFLEAKKYARRVGAMLLFIKYSGVLLLLMAFTVPYGVAVRIGAVLLGLNAITILLTGILCWRSGYQAARFFVLAWASYLVGALLIVFRNFGLLPDSFITGHSVEIGNVMEVILLSLALGDKYSLMRREKAAAQAEALRIQKEANETLEQRVKERTQELAEANEELNNTIEELDITNTRLNEINEELAHKNADITSSINYANRIQQAMLPRIEQVKTAFNDFFVLFRPRDIVSGDFYWFSRINGRYSAIAAVDCTGHGVPGAFMSMIGNELLHEIIDTRRELRPDVILQQMHVGIKKVLRQDETFNQDGMDLALCVIDHEEKVLHFGGAKNPLIYVANGELHHIRGSRFSIGGKELRIERQYETYQVSFAAGEICCYMFSDGYADQFGGAEGKKFMLKKLKNLLFDIHHLPMNEQLQALQNALADWQRYRYRQVDDILVMGFKIG
jgi:serine phosphatase RsbU (regulator of sigma subunit)